MFHEKQQVATLVPALDGCVRNTSVEHVHQLNAILTQKANVVVARLNDCANVSIREPMSKGRHALRRARIMAERIKDGLRKDSREGQSIEDKDVWTSRNLDQINSKGTWVVLKVRKNECVLCTPYGRKVRRQR